MQRRAIAGAVLLMLLAAHTAGAQTRLGFRSLGAHLGLVDPEAMPSAMGFGVVADFGNLAPNVVLDLNLDYWSKSEQATWLGYGYEASLQDLELGGTARYFFSPGAGRLQPYGCGGLGLHVISGETRFSGRTLASASDTKIGLDLGVGALLTTSGNATLFGELRYRLVSDLNQLALRAGVLVPLGK